MEIKGKIELRKLNLMGYTPETQVYFVQNAGGIAKFKAYCATKGFEVVDGAAAFAHPRE